MKERSSRSSKVLLTLVHSGWKILENAQVTAFSSKLFSVGSKHSLDTTMGAVKVDIDEWMIRNYLKLNQDKTDLVVISSRFHPMPDIGHITVGSECITPCDSVRNLGVQFDSIFSFEEHIKNICKSSFYHLRNIAKIRKYLSQDTCEILVHAFISSKLDHCNSLLHGLPEYLLARLQAVQNAAARVVTLTPKHDHMTPILINLHWLPVEFRITFKVLLLVYKALHGLAPSYISDLLNFKTYSRSLRSSCKEYLAVPRSRLKTYGDRAFSIAGLVPGADRVVHYICILCMGYQ